MGARHIIGGDMYYECLGNDRYRVTMIVYRDCQSAGGAQFDSAPNSLLGTVTVYREDSNIPYIRTITLPEPEISEVNPKINNPCLIVPPNVCVEKGVYTFDVTLPNSDFSYQIVYQRCCRNNTITNIRLPGETGATYTIELTPEAQDICNNSIQFNNFPPIVICNEEPLEFEHSAFDPDNDSSTTIKYAFCTPYEGGGLMGSTEPGDPMAFSGVAPNPDAPPPYRGVNFVGGDFTSSSPMGGDPVISIDPETGLITGTPRDLGQYVVGVCATEFDSSGKVLSVIRRDFQFNVARCDPRVFAEIEADAVDNGEYVINSCGSSTINFINNSYQEEFIESYRWEFDINGNFENYNSRNPTVSFPGLGTYKGTMYLNEGTMCSDTAEIEVNIFGGITNSLDYEYDTCVAGPIELMGFDSTGNDRITERTWYFGINDSLSGQKVSYEYITPGLKTIRYVVKDNTGCTAESILNVPYYPIPNEIIVETILQNNCVPARVFFDNMSYPLDNSYEVYWEFGDGDDSDEINPTHTYQEPGTYQVRIRIESPIGCIYEGELDQTVQAIPSPVAGFTYSPDQLNQFNKQVNFLDRSIDAAQWDWLFPNDQGSSMQNPTFTFPDTGIYEITQIVTHQNGCMDSITRILDIAPKATFFLPNAFTPNGDGRNDEFRGAGDLIGVRNFQMSIFNRWGELVFQTKDPQDGWNGRKNNVGLLLPQDVYVVKVYYLGPRGETVELEGFATLIH